MSTYRIRYTSAAARQVRKLDRSVADRIVRTVALLAENPRPPAATHLVGERGTWRARTGDYRIVYEIHDDVLLVLVVAVGHRRDVYRHR